MITDIPFVVIDDCQDFLGNTRVYLGGRKGGRAGRGGLLRGGVELGFGLVDLG